MTFILLLAFVIVLHLVIVFSFIIVTVDTSNGKARDRNHTFVFDGAQNVVVQTKK